ncbi:hypothetical protein BDP27DRAFT_1498308 [Rhodocollybia butyracea]|uniref:Uncharacterized protein n=1 Tax=Rhodocollybia butyracea TaxID=206335 RepID=A0A9P5P9L8_9AGAR|nr:hypothetical protein BDP27DRAFT_1498308 [Rhodocollybia butyracea]
MALSDSLSPRKCVGYGLCDGEGNEHLWHSLSHMIAYGRVAGLVSYMYNLDSQFNFNNEENLFNIRKKDSWLQCKVHACDVNLQEAEKVLAECGFPEDVLHCEWAVQVNAQTKPLPRELLYNSYATALNIFIYIRATQRLRKRRQAHVDELGRQIIDVSSEHWEIATAELELDIALNVLNKVKAKVTKKESAMGVTAQQQLHCLLKSPFLAKKMNAWALKTRIGEHLRGRKFDLDCQERSYRKQQSEQRINEHTQGSVKCRDPGIADLAR